MAGKPFWRSKTFWFNVLAFVVAVAAAFGYTGELPADWQALVPAAVAIINIILRFITREPVRLR